MKVIWSFVSSIFFLPLCVHAQVVDIIFPVIGDVSYTDDFNLTSGAGRIHHGNDLMGEKMMPLVAAASGTVAFLTWPEASYGYYMSIYGDDGYVYNYVHINNDTPNTDDGIGGGRYAYAPYVEQGEYVEAGQLIGYMGDSGNAEGVGAHLHFEIRTDHDEAFSPYESLQAATHIDEPVVPAQRDDEILPFAEFQGGARIALGNMDADDALEIVAGAGAGGGPQVVVYGQQGKVLQNFFAFDEVMSAGIDVTTADIDSDGVNEIIAATGAGVETTVAAFTVDGVPVWNTILESGNLSGARISAGDMNGDGIPEIVAVPASSGSSTAVVLNADGTVKRTFSLEHLNCAHGFDVGVRAKEGERKTRVVIGTGAGCPSQVFVLKPKGGIVRSFFPYGQQDTQGVMVDVVNMLSTERTTQILTAPAENGTPLAIRWNLKGEELARYAAFEEWWTGGFDVAFDGDLVYIASGPGYRRASIRALQ